MSSGNMARRCIRNSVDIMDNMKKYLLEIFFWNILLFLVAIMSASAFSQNKSNEADEDFIKFSKKRLTIADGLCSDEVKQVYQDAEGFIWFATKNGISLYDGHAFTTFKSNLHNWNLISSNDITSICDDSAGNLWIGTAEGLNVLDKATGTFRQIHSKVFKNNPISQVLPVSDGNVLAATDQGLVVYKPEVDSCIMVSRKMTGDVMPQTSIKSLLEDHNGDIWIGTWNEGLYRYSIKDRKMIKYPKMNGRNSAHVLFEDSSKNIWVGTWEYGLQKLKNPYDMDSFSWETFTHVSGDSNSLISNIVYAISENTATNTIWVGTPSGISVLDKGTGKIIENFYPSNDSNSISGGEVNSILTDRDGTIWIGMLGSGVNIFDMHSSNIFGYDDLGKVQSVTKTNSVRSIFIDADNNMWLGVGTRYLVQIDRNTGMWKCNGEIPGFAHKYAGYTVLSFAQSKFTGKIWIGTYDGGVVVYDPKTAEASVFKTETTQWLPGNRVYAITEDDDGSMWLGTQNGFSVHSPSGRIFARFDNIEAGNHNISKIAVNSIVEGSDGAMWIATKNCGIIRVEGKGGSASNYSMKVYNPENGKLNAANALCLLVDAQKRLWVGTQGGGLSLYDSASDSFVSKNTQWELPGDDIYSMLSDKKGNLWFASNYGLANLIFPEGGEPRPTYRLYTSANGLQGDAFNTNVAFMTADGEMFFGGHHGYNNFFPDKITSNDLQAPIVITDFSVYGNSWLSLDSITRAEMSREVPNHASRITLDYKQNNFAIEFAVLDYKTPEQDRYSYMLEGHDNAWRYVDNWHRYAFYNNLAPGTYTFLLRATNSSGKWVDRKQTLQIKILPPPWLSWWAYMIYAALIVAVIIVAYRFAKKKIRLYNERELEKIISDKANEMNHIKLQFFTNITHELLTPLTIISASIEELRSNAPQFKDTYNAMSVNTNRLIRLIQQILEFRKAETGNLKLKVSKGDLAAFIHNHTNSFIPLMRKKDIHFTVNCDPEPFPAYFDTDKIDKILYNLLSNASKYNKEGGHVWITLSMSPNKKNAILSVKDDGEGMSAEAQKTLFQRFYEGDYRRHNTTGTGIGLSLAKDLVDLHHGTIEGHSEPGNGMEFIIKFPITRDAYDDDCIDDAHEQLPITKHEIIVDGNEAAPDGESVAEEQEVPKPGVKDGKHDGSAKEKVKEKEYTLLLVEDNIDLLQVMARMLSHYYNVLTAHNGKEAIDVITNNDIQLIISDIMMPDVDGLQFCKYIKSHLETSHIPVILLTAKDREEDRIEAYQSGADAYIKKPFNLSLLQARINNLLRIRGRANKDFKKQLVFDINELNYTSIDEEFLKKAISTVQQHLSDPDYDQVQFVEDMGTSKSTLFRKLKSLTGLSYSSFVRNIRIKAACQIMEEKRHIRISELAYAIGFNDPKYFSACFKKEFGIHPSEYMKRFVDDSGEIINDESDDDSKADADPGKE